MNIENIYTLCEKKSIKIAWLTDLEVGSDLLKVIDLCHILSDPVKVTEGILAPLFKVIRFCDELLEIFVRLVQLFEAAVDLVGGLEMQESKISKWSIYRENYLDVNVINISLH